MLVKRPGHRGVCEANDRPGQIATMPTPNGSACGVPAVDRTRSAPSSSTLGAPKADGDQRTHPAHKPGGHETQSRPLHGLTGNRSGAGGSITIETQFGFDSSSPSCRNLRWPRLRMGLLPGSPDAVAFGLATGRSPDPTIADTG